MADVLAFPADPEVREKVGVGANTYTDKGKFLYGVFSLYLVFV